MKNSCLHSNAVVIRFTVLLLLFCFSLSCLLYSSLDNLCSLLI